MIYREDTVQIQIANYLRQMGYLFTATNGGVYVKSVAMRTRLKRMGYLKGCPDMIVWIPGGTLCIEVKRPTVMNYSIKSQRNIIADAGGRQSEDQKAFENNVKKIGGHHYIIASDLGQVVEYIRYKKIKPIG